MRRDRQENLPPLWPLLFGIAIAAILASGYMMVKPRCAPGEMPGFYGLGWTCHAMVRR